MISRGWLPAMAIMAVFFWVSHQPGDSIHLPEFWNADKLFHLLAYSVLGISIAMRPLFDFWFNRYHLATSKTWELPSIKSLSVLVGITYGVLDEFHQSFIPGRQAGLGDFIADTLGVIAGYYGVVQILLILNKSRKSDT